MNAHNWTDWPERTGQQFVYHNGEMWVGNIDIKLTDPDYGRLLLIWRGSAYYHLWENQKSNFKFQPIIWPESPAT